MQSPSALARGIYNQGHSSVAIGRRAGHVDQSSNAVAIGFHAGYERQRNSSVAIGYEAGRLDQSDNSVAIGRSAGETQDSSCVAIGPYTGSSNQGVIGQPYEDVTTYGAWTNRASTGGTGGNWPIFGTIASNSAGDKMFAVSGGAGVGRQWYSTDSGVTWANPPDPSLVLDWRSIASDSAGLNLAACEIDSSNGAVGGVWLSKDSGLTWINQSIAGGSPPVGTRPPTKSNWHGIASNADGSVVVVCNGGNTGEIWASQDATAAGTTSTWFNVSPTGTGAPGHDWETITSNYDGSPSNATQFLATSQTTTGGVVSDGIIWRSTDSGANWNDLSGGGDPPASAGSWRGICSSKTGQSIFAVLNGGNIWRSQSNGVTGSWTELTTGGIPLNQNWIDIACDDTGTNVVAGGGPPGSGVGIWISQDGGDTWSDTIRAGAAAVFGGRGFASNGDGTILGATEAVFGDGPIWTTAPNVINRTFEPGNSVAIGAQAGQTNQAYQSIAIGSLAGQIDQSANSVAIGAQAGQTNQKEYSVAIGYQAGSNDQDASSVAIGAFAGYTLQRNSTVAIGQYAGYLGQRARSIAIGDRAAETSQEFDSIAIGRQAGQTSQKEYSVAIGYQAGYERQRNSSVAIGRNAGRTDQSFNSVAIGIGAGLMNRISSVSQLADKREM